MSREIFIPSKYVLSRWLLSASIPAVMMACSTTLERRAGLDAQSASEQARLLQQSNKMADQGGSQSNTYSSEVRCSITIEQEIWSKGKSAFVSVVIENVSGSTLDVKIAPSFTLVEYGKEANSVGPHDEPNQYWSPVDVTKSIALSPNVAVNVTLGKDQTLQSRIDLGTLRWARSISSIWPSEDLFEAVSPGRYELYLTIEEVGRREAQSIRQTKALGTMTVRSNEVRVRIQ